ncbi:MAG: hypothetical protein J7641_11875 [Cyanobacteria bacterium SID2]|nr:hypothetical protein [Cyanobacteria bacterium SID2]MBP0003001.1 hypothetical protein [Cyanobacteria bacterium SBC]
MQRLPISSFDRDGLYVSGDVTIHPSAAIANGVVLQAGENSRISIAAGVCIGLGAVLHAYDGAIEIETGANLGAGALVVGCCTIGAHACIGAASTVLDARIAPNCILPTGSIVGDLSRSVEVGEEVEVGEAAENRSDDRSNENCVDRLTSDVVQDPENSSVMPNNEVGVVESEDDPNPSPERSNPPDTTPPNPPTARFVYGEIHLNRILTTLFPHSNRFRSESKDSGETE